jgi:hypothetical protein
MRDVSIKALAGGAASAERYLQSQKLCGDAGESVRNRTSFWRMF